MTYNNVESLLNGLNKFVSDVDNNHIKCFIPHGIIRIKNGFNDILTNWKNMNDAQYCDIKLNVIYCNNTNNNDSQKKEERMIIEIQFLLSFLLKAKKMGHKYYGIIRQDEFFTNIKNEIYNIDRNYEKYKLKIFNMVSNKDGNRLVKQLIWRPNVVLSMIKSIGAFIPFLNQIQYMVNQYPKFSLFVLNCIFHLSFILLNESNDKNNKYLSKYFQFGSPNQVISSFQTNSYLYGVSLGFKSIHDNGYQFCKLILEKEYINVLEFTKDQVFIYFKRGVYFVL